MFGFVRARVIARLANLLALSAMLSAWPGHAVADKSKDHTRSALQQVLFDSDPGSWRTAMTDGRRNSPLLKEAVPAPARFFTISAVLARDTGSGTAKSKLASLEAGTNLKSDAPALVVPGDYSGEPFGFYLFRAPEGAVWTKWRTVEKEMKAETLEIDRCRADLESCSLEVARFVELTDRARLKGGRDRIQIVNANINENIRYQNDLTHHGVVDQWSSPIATLRDGIGDCEDYAIAKYVALRQAGVADADLKVLLVRDNVSRQDHAVLSVRQDGRWLMLDNRWSEIMEASASSRLTPLFALDENGVKLFASRYANALPVESEFEPLPASDEAGICSACRSSTPLLM